MGAIRDTLSGGARAGSGEGRPGGGLNGGTGEEERDFGAVAVAGVIFGAAVVAVVPVVIVVAAVVLLLRKRSF